MVSNVSDKEIQSFDGKMMKISEKKNGSTDPKIQKCLIRG